jgi:SPOR domain
MAAQASHHAPSGRFIRAYLLTWGLLAAGGLTYLASLAWHPQLFSVQQRPQMAETDAGVQAANRALAEVGSVRRTVTEIQKDVGRIKDTIGQRELEEKAAQARLSALEDRVTTMATTPIAQATPESAPNVTTAKSRSGDKARATAEKRQTGAEPTRAPTHIITLTETPAVPVPAAKAQEGSPRAETQTAPPKIETGSIPAPAVITFGEPEVTPAREAFAVQVAAGPSLDALRLSWSVLVERHSALGSLQPRFVGPRKDGGHYRLLAGPLPSKAEADKVCDAMGVGKQGCLSTPYIGDPL